MLKVEASQVVNKVTFQVDKQALSNAKASIKDLTEFSNKQKLYEKPLKQLEANSKAAAKKVENALNGIKVKTTGKDGKPAKGDVAAAQAAKAAAKAAQMQEKADLKVLSTVTKIRDIQGVGNREALEYAQAAKMVANEYQRGEKSLQRMNHDMAQLVSDARKLGKANTQAAKAAKAPATKNRRAKAPKAEEGEFGIGAVTGYLSGAFAVSQIAGTLKNSIVDTGEENLSLVRKSKAVNADPNAIKTLIKLEQLQGVDANADTISDNLKDVVERLGDSISNSQLDAKTGLYKGGDNAVDTIMNKLKFSKSELKGFSKNPIEFLNQVANRGQKAGYSDNEIQHMLEDVGNDLFYTFQGLKDDGKGFKETFAQLRDSGQLLTDTQLQQVEEYGQLSNAFDNLMHSAEQNLFTGFLDGLHVNAKDLEDNTAEVGKVAKELGEQLGDLTTQVSGFLKEIDSGVNYLHNKFPSIFGTTAQETYNNVAVDSANSSADFVARHTGFDPRSVGASLRKHLGIETYDDQMLLNKQYGDALPTVQPLSGMSVTPGSYSPAQLQRQQAPVIQNNVAPAPVTVSIEGTAGLQNLIQATVTQGLNDHEESQSQAISSALMHGN